MSATGGTSTTGRSDWMVPGAEVAVLTTSADGRWPRLACTTIDRILKRDVVLTNGDRFNAARPSRSRGTWDGSDTLLPTDHPRVVAAAARLRFTRTRNSLRNLLSEKLFTAGIDLGPAPA